MSRASLEERRLMAAEDLRSGKRQCVIVQNYQVSRATASRWARRVANGQTMRTTKATGRPKQLRQRATAEEKR